MGRGPGRSRIRPRIRPCTRRVDYLRGGLDLILAELLGRLLDQQGRELHWFDVHPLLLSNRGRHRLQAREGSRCEWDEPPLGPARIRRIRRPSAQLVRGTASRCPPATLARRSSPCCGDRSSPFGAESCGNLLHVDRHFHFLLLSEVADREVLVADDQADLSLTRLTSHRSAEAAELGEILGIFDIGVV